MKQGWEIKKIKDICDKASSNIAQNKITELNGDYPVFGASGFVQNVDFYHRDTEYIGIVKDGSGVGRVNTYPAYSSLLGTLQYIIPKEGYALNYVAYALKSLNLAEYASGAAIPHIYFKDYGEETISVPPLEEQERIVAELDCLSGVIERKREQLRELDALAQSIFYQTFGDPITNEKRWEVKKLGEVCDVCSSRRVFVDELVEDGVPFYRGTEIGQMAEGEIIIPTLYITPDHYERLKDETGIPQIGDLLLPSICNDGRIWLVSTDAPYYFKDGRVLWIKCAGKIDGQFLRYQLKNIFINNYNKIASGTTFAELKIFILRELKINIPPLALQQQFADRIERIEQQKELIKKSISETETLFNARMNYYFN